MSSVSSVNIAQLTTQSREKTLAVYVSADHGDFETLKTKFLHSWFDIFLLWFCNAVLSDSMCASLITSRYQSSRQKTKNTPYYWSPVSAWLYLLTELVLRLFCARSRLKDCITLERFKSSHNPSFEVCVAVGTVSSPHSSIPTRIRTAHPWIWTAMVCCSDGYCADILWKEDLWAKINTHIMSLR